MMRVLLSGRPNVGKSSLFNCISETYAVVSNYPGTTVGITRGHFRQEISEEKIEILDLPGAYHFCSITEEERLSLQILMEESQDLILHVVEARSLPLHLPYTLCLMETGKPVVLILNMMDELDNFGVKIDIERLSENLGIKVLPISALKKSGIEPIKDCLLGDWTQYFPKKSFLKDIMKEIGEPDLSLNEIHTKTLASRDLLAYLYYHRSLNSVLPQEKMLPRIEDCKQQLLISDAINALSKNLVKNCFFMVNKVSKLKDWLSTMMIHPFFGYILLAFILYFGFFKFVGEFAAGTVVGYLEENLFGEVIMPKVSQAIESVVPWSLFIDFLVGEYGVLSLGLTYALALVLPIVFFFFLVFSVLEDSGYLPRLALLVDRVFKLIGLNGRSVIPIVLGFGCDTMATITTRTLETQKEKMISTFLLAFAIPCSAQLGLITGLLGRLGFVYWVSYVCFIFLMFFISGFILNRLLPGKSTFFYMEMPVIRLPRIKAVLTKSFSRMKWYFFEVVPLFIIASVILFILKLLNLIDALVLAISPVMSFIGLPSSASESFLIGFFRRDFGAAGFFELVNNDQASITPHQIFIGSVVLTLFVPCIAHFMIMAKERGLVKAVTILFAVTSLSLLTGGILHRTLLLVGL